MRTYVRLMIGVLSIIGATACSDDILEKQQDILSSVEGKNVISVNVPGTDSRVEFDATGSNIQVKWKESGETFSLYTNNPDFDSSKPAEGPHNFKYKNYTYTQVSGNKFSGNATLKVGNEIYAYYPCVGEYYNFLNGVPYILFNQTGELNPDMTYMYIRNVNVDNVDVLQFNHITSIMKATFKVNGTDVTTKIKRMQILLPYGAYTDNYLNLTGSSIAYTYSWGGNEINIDLQKELEQFFIYLPIGIDEGEKITFKVYDEDTYYTGQLTAAKDIVTGKIYPVEVKLISQGTYLWTPETVASQNITGTGTSTDPFMINDANDLQWMIENAQSNGSSHYKLNADLTIQTSELDPWDPIGTVDYPFNGFFDGNNKAINGVLSAGGLSSVKAKTVNSTSGIFGFFGHVGTDGVVSKLWINADVKGADADETYTGGVAGYNEGKIIESRSNKCVKGGNSTIGISYTGGVAGYNAGIIENGTGSGEVKGNITTKTIAYTGGVTGYNAGTLNQCSAYGTVIAAQADEKTYAGGIAGFNSINKMMSSCTNYCSVSGAECPENYIGGLVGSNQGSLSSCNSQGYGIITITCPTEVDVEKCYIGGLTALNDGGNISFCNVYNATQIIGGKANSIYVGGLAAWNLNNGTIENAICIGEVKGGTAVEVIYTGGLVAYNDAGLLECMIENNVIGGSAETSCTGGLVGVNTANGYVYGSLTQMGCFITGGIGTITSYTGIFAGSNNGVICGCCYAGGNQSETDMDLVGIGSGRLVDDEQGCLIHSQQ